MSWNTVMSPDNTDPLTQPHTHKYCIFIEKALLSLYLGVRGGKVDAERARGCQLILHSSATNAYICRSRIITELSEPFSGPQLPTAYEKTPIKQLSFKVGPNSVIWVPKKHWEGDHSCLTANSESGAKSIKAQIKNGEGLSLSKALKNCNSSAKNVRKDYSFHVQAEDIDTTLSSMSIIPYAFYKAGVDFTLIPRYVPLTAHHRTMSMSMSSLLNGNQTNKAAIVQHVALQLCCWTVAKCCCHFYN